MDLPPLDGLRVFEAAARLGHFQQAAAELHLTPSAVSHRIKTLEAQLQVPLFRRAGRGVELTAEGRAYAAAVGRALDDLRQATRALTSERGPLMLSVTPAFAMRWLLPRLGDFQRLHPEIEVRFSSDNRLVDFDREDVDLGIRFGLGGWPALEIDRLFPVDTLPVCRPAMIGGDPPLKSPNDLTNFRLLHLRNRPDDWRMWLLLAGADAVDPTEGPTFDTAPEMLEAAISGLGVAMADRQMIGRDVDRGLLAVPFDIHMPSRGAYYLVMPPRRKNDPRIQAFRAWLLDQAAVEAADTPAS